MTDFEKLGVKFPKPKKPKDRVDAFDSPPPLPPPPPPPPPGEEDDEIGGGG